MNHETRRRSTADRRLCALGETAARSKLVLIDADAVLLARPAERDLLRVLRRSGVIGPLVERRELWRARRAARGAGPVSGRATKGLRRDELVRLVAELAADLRLRAVAEGVELVDSHVAAGDFVVIATDSVQELADALASEFGAHRGCGTRRTVANGVFDGSVVVSSAGPDRDAALRTIVGEFDSSAIVVHGA